MASKSLSKLLLSVVFAAGTYAPVPAFAAGTMDKVIEIFGTLSGVEVDTGDEAATLTMEEVTFIGANPTADGGISADELDINGLEFSADKGGTTVKTIKILGYVSAPPDKIKQPGATRFDRFEATNIQIGDDKLTIPVSYVLVTASDYADNMPHKGTIEVKGLVVPIKADDPQMAEVAALGYKEFAIDASFKGNWDPKSGRVALEGLSVSAKDAATVQLSFALGGFTPDVVKQMVAAKGDTNQMLGLMQGLSIESATLRVENSSLFERAADAAAKKQGTTKEALLQQGSAMVPMMISAIQNPAFEKKISDAVTAFIASPKSLTVKIAPAQPVPVPQIIGVAGAAPQTLPDVLGADVKAND
jgi:hypothetical protein